MTPRVLVLDNRDSFVFNLVDEFARLGADCTVVRSDLSLDQLNTLRAELSPQLVLLSPGPGQAAEHPVLLPFLRTLPAIPILGVCLGMQAMVTALGGRVERAPDGPRHGRSSRVTHNGDALFDGLPPDFLVGRYHSLAATQLPAELQPIAWTTDRRTLLALRHRGLPWIGLQFHPESVLTPHGRQLLSHVLSSLT